MFSFPFLLVMFSSEVSMKVDYVIEITKSIPYILSFWSMLLLKYWRYYGSFKIVPTFQPRELAIWLLTKKKHYRVLICTRLHMWTKFGDDWLKKLQPVLFSKQTDKQTVKRTYLPNVYEILANNKYALMQWGCFKNIMHFGRMMSMGFWMYVSWQVLKCIWMGRTILLSKFRNKFYPIIPFSTLGARCQYM